MNRFTKLVLAAGALRGLRKRRQERKARKRERPERIVPPAGTDPGAERGLAFQLLLATAASLAFIWVYADDGLSNHTQWEAVTLGLAIAFIAGAFLLVAKRLVVTEHNSEPYPQEAPEDQDAVAQIAEESGSRFTRKKLLGALAAMAGGTLGLAVLAPAASLGPFVDSHLLLQTPWRRGKRLVREDNVPIKADEIEQETFYTAYAEGYTHDDIGSPIVIVRLDPAAIKERRAWAPQGIVAYSKVCTHAGCAVALYRKPTFAPVQQRPALVCPCHYSTFDPAQAGKVLFGPAGRALPQLPLTIDRKGYLRAAGNFSSPPGPSWWGVRLWKARFKAQ